MQRADRRSSGIQPLGYAAVFAWVIAVSMSIGCEQTKTSGSGPGGIFGAAGGTGSSAGPSTWSIALAQFQGSNHQTAAQQQAQQYAAQTGLDGFSAVNAGPRSYVYFGEYDDPKSDAARQDLARLQQLRRRGRFHPQSIGMSPRAQPVSAGSASTGRPQWNLARVSNEKTIYTLQVASFNEDYEGDRRKAAEQYTAKLRQQGEDAYFYHGPHESLVTIGLFGHAAVKVIQEAGPQRGQTVYHPYITDELQERHPHVRVNGAKVDVPWDSVKYAPTFLVRTPAAR